MTGFRAAVLVAAVLAVATLAAACRVPGAAIPTVSATPDVGSPADGVVVAVDSAGLSDVRGFTLRTDGGASFEFKLGPLENATEFPPGHLQEHQLTSERIRVYFRIEGRDRIAYRIEDAPR